MRAAVGGRRRRASAAREPEVICEHRHSAILRYFEEIPLRHEVAEQAFTQQPEALLRRLAGEADRNGEQLEVEVGFMTPAARVRLTVGEPVQVSGRLLVPIEWKPLYGHHLLPGLQGELELGGLGPQRTQIALSARYQPPLGPPEAPPTARCCIGSPRPPSGTSSSGWRRRSWSRPALPNGPRLPADR
jgi:hypothetical protein